MTVINITPTKNKLLAKVAWPELRLLVATGVPPSWKMTDPVGVPAAGATALTVAVKVTDWPKTEGLAEEAREGVLLAWPTVWVTIPEVFVLKFPSPLYTAVRECEPTESEAFV